VQIVTVEARGHRANVHLAIEDATGDSAIVEFIDGQPRVHHGRQHRIMTNDPSHDAQIALLVAQDFSKPASTMPLRAM
jgi:choloylglycine hydrolase